MRVKCVFGPCSYRLVAFGLLLMLYLTSLILSGLKLIVKKFIVKRLNLVCFRDPTVHLYLVLSVGQSIRRVKCLKITFLQHQ